jgi:ZIP family zinc transporter
MPDGTRSGGEQDVRKVSVELHAARARVPEDWDRLPEVTDEADEWFRESGEDHYTEHPPRFRQWAGELTGLMGEAALWAFLGAGSLLIGTELVFLFRPGQRTIGLVMAFGAGAMISAVSFELVEEALEAGAPTIATLGLAAGAVTFYVGDMLIARRGGAARKRSTGEQSVGSPLAIVLGAALDGVPESMIVGLSLVLGGGVSVSFVAATFLSNLPEAMAATTGLQHAGWHRWSIWRLWLLVVGVSVVAGVLGFVLFDAFSGTTGAFIQAFAAGALLTMLADTMMPEAFEFGGKLVGLLTVAGFGAALAIAQLS